MSNNPVSELAQPPDDPNDFITAARTPPDQNDANKLTLTPSELASIRSGRPMRRFVGFLGKVMEDDRRKIYTTSRLNEGVEVPKNSIRVYSQSPKDLTDGLVRDIIWVDSDADIFYFSTRPRPSRDPSGGNLPPDNVL